MVYLRLNGHSILTVRAGIRALEFSLFCLLLDVYT